MFEKFFANKGPEQAEASLIKIADKKLSAGVNGPAMFLAFEAIRKENKEKNLGLTNNHLLNIVKNSALSQSSCIEDELYGGSEQTVANINSEIEKLRQSLPEEEKGN